MTHHGSGIVLKTIFDQRENKVLRTVFDKQCVYYQTITEYVPPLFLVVNYEDTAYTRSCFLKTQTPSSITGVSDKDDDDNDDAFRYLKTDERLQDNIKYIESLLVTADCNYEAFQFTFLRLETVGDYQRHFEKLYPLWNVGVGALARLTFSTWQKRLRALRALAYNAAANQDVYTINYAANMSPVTIVDYLEPLFAYCLKATNNDAGAATDQHPTTQTTNHVQTSSFGKYNTGKKTSLAAAVNTSEMFEIEFCIIDDPVMETRRVISGHRVDQESSFSRHSTNTLSTSATAASKRSGAKRRNGTAGSDLGGGGGGGGGGVVPGCGIRSNNSAVSDVDIAGAGQRNGGRKKQRQALVLEKPRAMCGSLSVHDVRPYFAMLHTSRLSRLSLDQLEELPVVVVRCERDFCSTTCCVMNRTDNQLTVMHVYYCWNSDVHRLLSSFAVACQSQRKNDHIMVAVSALCSEDIEARLKMLEDLRNVIWKDSTNAYIRLVIDESHDKDMLARHFYEPLVFRVQRHSADLETEIRCSVQSAQVSGSTEIFRNAITLDCQRLCNDLDPNVCKFARAYRNLVESPAVHSNGYVRLDQQCLDRGTESKLNVYRLLGHRQDLYARLVSQFRSERILETAFDMASELRLGLLDVFGTAYNERRRTPYERQQQPTHNTHAPDDPVFDSLRASNCVFVETLLNSSTFYGSSGSAAACVEFFGRDKTVKPVSQYARGLYRYNMIEFDLCSAYPSVSVLYNISPETTAIVQRNKLRELDKALEELSFSEHFASDDDTPTTTTTTRHGQKNAAVAKRQKTTPMTSFYNQIGHVNEICSNLVVVSLRPEIYVGFLSRIMETLVLKRTTQNVLMNAFYKKLANVIYGCTGNTTAVFNDLFSPQCASAISSLCKSVMLRTLQNVPAESVLISQTDGALLYAGPHNIEKNGGGGGGGDEWYGLDGEHSSCKILEDVVRASINNIVSDVGNVSSSVRIVPRIRSVDLCLVIDQNRYLIMYTDGKTVAKGQQHPQSSVAGFRSSPGTECFTQSLLSHITAYVQDSFNPKGHLATELNRFLDSCFDRIDTLTSNKTYTECFVTVTVPTVNELLYGGTSQETAVAGFGHHGLSAGGRFHETPIDTTTTTRFGDTLVVWPVVVYNDKNVLNNEFRLVRPLYNAAVRPNHVFVVRNWLRYWVKWMFTICYPNQDEADLIRMFYAICKKRENGVIAT